MDTETRKSLEAIIENLYEDEKRNFEFDAKDNRAHHHIFLDIQKVAEWLERTKLTLPILDFSEHSCPFPTHTL